MQISFFDFFGIAIFSFLTIFIYRRGWFSSFYEFIKFVFVFIVSFIIGLLISLRIPNAPYLTKFQTFLLLGVALFAFFWKIISFKKIFFKITDGIIGVNRFLFLSRLDKILSLALASFASFFICFFILSIIVSSSTGFPALQKAIEDSKIIKPALYKIYFVRGFGDIGLFQNIAYTLVPGVAYPNVSEREIQKSAIETFRNRLNEVRQKMGLSELSYFLIPRISLENPFTEPTPVPKPPPPKGTYFPPSPTQADAHPTPTKTPVFFPPRTPLASPTPTPPLPTQSPPTPTPVLNLQALPIPPTINIPRAEADILRLTNEARSANGLAPFVLDPALSAVARAYSQDMEIRNFFAHVNPDGLDLFQRMRIGGISFTTVSENIGGGSSPEIIVANWMRSSSHRASILNPAFRKIGIGVAVSSIYGLLATQNFTD